MIGIDNEYISENAAPGDVPGPRPDVTESYCEIMQLGACKLDAAGKEIGILNLTVKAHRIHRIPAWLTRLTAMTEEKRATGITFPEALAELVAFAEDEVIWTFGGDWYVLDGNAKAHGLRNPFRPFRRLKPRLDELGIGLARYQAVGVNEVCSGGLYKVLGIELPEILGIGEHDAAHDSRSLAHSIHHLRLK